MIAFWVLAFLIQRSAVLLLGFDATFFWEECYRLVAAEALVKGWHIPLLALQADPYAGGSLVISILAAPVVALFGPSLLALKYVAMLWAAAGLVIWLALAERFFGRRLLHGFALCYVLAPPLFVIYNLIAMGSHAETVTLGAGQFLLMLAYVSDTGRSKGRLFAWAAFSALSIWFTYVSVLTFAVCLAYALVVGALPPRRWPLLLAAFACGFTPWILYNLSMAGAGLGVVSTTFTSPDAAGRSYPAILFDLIKAGMPVALRFADLGPFAATGKLLIPRAVFSYSYFSGFSAAWLFCLWHCAVRFKSSQNLRSGITSCPELPMLALFPLFALVIAASNHGFNEEGLVPFLAFRILVPALPAVFFTMALACARLSRHYRITALCALAVLGAVATVQVAGSGATHRPAVEREARSLGATAMGHLLVYKHGANMRLINSRIAAISEDLRPSAYQGIGFSLAYRYGFGGSIGEFRRAIEGADPIYRADVIRGVETALGSGMPQVRPVPVSRHTLRMLETAKSLDALGAAP